jgi:hypothetical protein
MSEPKTDSYPPEPGSSLHEIITTQKLSEIQDEETEEKRTREKFDREMDEKMGSKGQEMKELRMQSTHEKRVTAGQIAEGYAVKDHNDIENAAYQKRLQREKDGDKTSPDEMDSEFYSNVYPEYRPYLEERRREEPKVDTGIVLGDFLQGADLIRSSAPHETVNV